ncbi:hypothetical protein RN001_003356 [Aquatica leii]|uniref:Uncharacterized protein n=1 Tax=Aquatica leii TaxID=1421715 RepID=A0AAN7ST05_9COLE|nr:hypothetical protein RN001_003356 [Aquatica leii]
MLTSIKETANKVWGFVTSKFTSKKAEESFSIDVRANDDGIEVIDNKNEQNCNEDEQEIIQENVQKCISKY